MCGIVGYVGEESAKDILLTGLKNLEYRGYDSSGIAFKDNNIKIIKSVGKIKNLEDKLKNEYVDNYKIGIAHTRWATHGEANLVNAHPHTVGSVTLVHNGIIENAKELKDKLINEGVNFNSDTDTEVIAALINKYLDDDIIKTISKVMGILKGSYALGIIIEGVNDKIYIAKKDSPLVVGVSDKGNLFASDITAINMFTNKFIFLDENDIAEVTKDNVLFYSNGKICEKSVNTINIDVNSKSKNGYPHYMLKEINEEPVVLEKTLKPYLEDFSSIPDLDLYGEIHIVACGSAMYAGMIGKTLFEEKANTRAICEVASEYRYKNNIYNNKTLVILISQSGETADTIAALRKAKELGQDTLAIVNVKTSTIAREADKAVFIEAGEEIAVATTKAYLLQVAVISLLALKLANSKKLIDNIDTYLDEFKKIPKLVKNVIDRDSEYKNIANKISKSNDVFFIGRKLDYAICLEGSLKLKEVSYIHSEAYQAGELKHGTISLISDGMPVFGILTDVELVEKSMSNIIEVESRGARTIIISRESLKQNRDLEICVPDVSSFTIGLLIVPVLQLIAYYTAVNRDCDVDKPKNLAKSVTVE